MADRSGKYYNRPSVLTDVLSVDSRWVAPSDRHFKSVISSNLTAAKLNPPIERWQWPVCWEIDVHDAGSSKKVLKFRASTL